MSGNPKTLADTILQARVGARLGTRAGGAIGERTGRPRRRGYRIYHTGIGAPKYSKRLF